MGFLAEKYNLGYVVEAGNHQNLACALIKMSDIKLRSFFYNRQLYDEVSAILSVEAGAKVIFDKIADLVKNRESGRGKTAS
jgi:hypothetical protein